MKLKIDDKVLQKIVPGATITKSQVKDDYIEETGGVYNNGLSFYTWDCRFNRISADISSTSCLVEISIDRYIWKTIGIFDTRNGTLYLVTSHDNFLTIQQKIKNGNHTHYMYPLTVNNGVTAEQLSLDGMGNDTNFSQRRFREAKKILGNHFSKLKRTIIITYEYTDYAAVDGLEILVDNKFNVIHQIPIQAYRSLKSNETSSKYDNQKEFTKKENSGRIVKWNGDKPKRSIVSEENNNGISN